MKLLSSICMYAVVSCLGLLMRDVFGCPAAERRTFHNPGQASLGRRLARAQLRQPGTLETGKLETLAYKSQQCFCYHLGFRTQNHHTLIMRADPARRTPSPRAVSSICDTPS